MMSCWTFDDVFEEGGVTSEPFDGGFGLIALGRIKKPSFYDFAVLAFDWATSGWQTPADNLFVTRRKDGTLVVAAWNLVDMDQAGAGNTNYACGLCSKACQRMREFRFSAWMRRMGIR